ncbi:ArnT family glycosyltransferase [Gillisia sp. JM1]|uniref:ArnT family glycosyltransferase n=1 Tax=Gillisia sp. JM1 TaxID=1283286 RepID=UPI000405099C|nr:glycosyltransferase family 39 protein [Gillisia sp. JM1]
MLKPNTCFHLLAFFAAILLYFIIQPYNLGFTPDSMDYLEVANSIESGNGITNIKGQIVNHWPPLFSLLLALISKITNSGVIYAGSILQMFLFYAFILFYSLVLRELKINFKLIIFSGILLVVSQVSINFSYFLSEGLFLVLLLVSFYLFLKWLPDKKFKHLFWSAFLCGLFFLTRYAGIAFIACYLFFILFFQDGKLNERVRNFLLFLGLIVLVISPWFIYQSAFEENLGGRKLAIHIIPFSKILDFFITVSYWFLGSALAIFLLICLVVIYVVKIKKSEIQFEVLIKKIYKRYQKAILLSFLFILIYPLFLIVSISFYDSYTPMDNRILSPLFIFILLFITFFLQTLKEHRQMLLLNGTILFLFLSFSSSVFPIYQNHYKNGSGYTKKKWAESQTLNYIKEKNSDIITYTNGIEIGKLHAQQDFYLLPRLSENLLIEKMKEEVSMGEAQIVYLKEVNWRNYLVSENELLEIFKENDVLRFEDGFIIRAFISE